MLVVFFFHFMFDDRGEVGSSEGRVGRVSIHLAVLEVFAVDVHVHVIVVKLEHSQLGVLEDEVTNLDGQIDVELLFGFFHFKVFVLQQRRHLFKLRFVGLDHDPALALDVGHGLELLLIHDGSTECTVSV